LDGAKLKNVVDVVSFCEKKKQEEHDAYPNVRKKMSKFFI
jgi:hypothetical protein